MAFTRRLHSSFPSEDGSTYHVDLEKDGTVSTDTEVDLAYPAYTIRWGRQGNDLFEPIKAAEAKIHFAIKQGNSAVLDDLRALCGSGPRHHRIRIFKDGAEWWRGYCLPGFTTTELSDRTQRVTVTAKERLASLDNVNFADSAGAAFTGRAGLIDIIADCAGKLGFSLNFKGVLNWYSWPMEADADPLKITINRDRYYSQNDEGETVFPSCLSVLRDILQGFGLQILQWNNVWHVLPAQHIIEDGTESITFTDYDSDGVDLTTTTTEDLVIDANVEAWLTDTDQLQGREAYQEAVSTYEVGPLVAGVRNGGFEKINTSSGLADGWNVGSGTISDVAAFDGSPIDYTLPDQTIRRPIDGHYSQAIKARERDDLDANEESRDWRDDSIKSEVGKWIYQNMGDVAAGTSGLQLSFQAAAYVENNDDNTNPESNKYKAFYAVKIGTQWYDPETDTWSASRVWIPMSSGDQTAVFYPTVVPFHTETIKLGDAPETGALVLELSEGIGLYPYSQDNVNFDYTAYMLYDSVTLDKSISTDNRAKSRSYRAYVTDVEDGRGTSSSFPFGDGPFRGAPGELRVPTGGSTSDWQVGPYTSTEITNGEKSGVPLGEFRAKEIMRSLRTSRKSIRFVLNEPPSTLAPYKALSFDGAWYYPVYFKIEQPSARVDVVGEELRYDTAPANTGLDETIKGGVAGSAGNATIHTDVTGRLDNILDSQKITKTSASLDANAAVTSISVEALPDPLFSGNTLTLINETTATRYTVTLSADAPTGATSISINSFTPDEQIVSGSYLYKGGEEVNAGLTITDQALKASVKGDKFADLQTAITAGNTVTSLDIDDALIPIRAGEKIYVEEGSTREQFEVNTAVSARDGSIDVVDKTAANSFTTAATVHYDSENLISTINLTPGQAKIKAALITLDGAIETGGDLRSSSFDGTIDPNTGQITDEGTTGFAISWEGYAVFHEVKLRNPDTEYTTSRLLVGDSSNHLVLDGPTRTLESDNYASGVSGVHLSPDLFETNNIVARGEFRASVFKKETISSVGGVMAVANSSALAESINSTQTYLRVKDQAFLSANNLRAKEGSKDEQMSVSTWDVTFVNTTNNVIQIAGDWRQELSIGWTFYIATGGNQGTWTITDIRYDSTNNRTNLDVQEDVTSSDDAVGISYFYTGSEYLYRITRAANATTAQSWEKGTAIMQWEQRIVLDASEGTNTPHISIVDSTGTEQTRLGNLNGKAGISGHGLWTQKGLIADWEITDKRLYKVNGGSVHVMSDSSAFTSTTGARPAVYAYDGTAIVAGLGDVYKANGAGFGLFVHDNGPNAVLFEASDRQKVFAGWNFTSAQIDNGSVTLHSSNGLSLTPGTGAINNINWGANLVLWGNGGVMNVKGDSTVDITTAAATGLIHLNDWVVDSNRQILRTIDIRTTHIDPATDLQPGEACLYWYDFDVDTIQLRYAFRTPARSGGTTYGHDSVIISENGTAI